MPRTLQGSVSTIDAQMEDEYATEKMASAEARGAEWKNWRHLLDALGDVSEVPMPTVFFWRPASRHHA